MLGLVHSKQQILHFVKLLRMSTLAVGKWVFVQGGLRMGKSRIGSGDKMECLGVLLWKSNCAAH